MATRARALKRTNRGISITIRLAFLTLAMAVSFGAILAISSRGFARLNSAVVQVNGVQGTFMASADNLLNQCYALDVFVLSHALRAASGEKDVGTSSQPPLDALIGQAKSASGGLEGIQSRAIAADVRSGVKAVFDDYMTSLVGIAGDIDAGKDRLDNRVTLVQNAFLAFNDRMFLMRAALRSAGDAAAADAAKLTVATSLGLSGVIIGAVLICVAISLFIIRSIARPLGGLVAAVRRIGDGDLSESLDMGGNDELGKIASSVDDLIRDLRSLIGGAKERLSRLESTGQSLSSTMEQTGAAVIEINSNIASTGGQLKEQSSAVAEATETVRELTRGIDELGKMIAGQVSVIADSSAAVEEMIANVESVAAKVETVVGATTDLVEEGSEGRARIEEMGESVASIVRYSENLSEAAELITQVAERTNILAMNAAIEAAHAGDTGKGFAVVADEIRKLAELSTAQSKDIAADLLRVSQAIEAVREASMISAASFGAILAKSGSVGQEIRAIESSMAEQREGGRLVLEGLARLRDITHGIELGSEGMAGGNGSILEQMKKLNGVNAAVVGNNAEMTSGTAEINQAIAGTIDLSSKNAELIEELRGDLDKFKI